MVSGLPGFRRGRTDMESGGVGERCRAFPASMDCASCPGDGRPSRGPPPTPIAAGKGSRSAAVDDSVLTEYLERSLHIPELSLLEPCSLSSALRRRRIPAEVDLGALLAGDAVFAEWLLASAAVVRAFRIDGHRVSEGDVRAAMEVAAVVFGIPGARRGELGRYLRRRRGAKEEFRWLRPAGAEDQAVLRGVWPDSYSAFRWVFFPIHDGDRRLPR